MERLTKHSKQTSHENGICCTHFRGPECLEVGGNCAMNCKWEEAAWSRLAAYEDKELEPEEVLPKDKADEIALKLMCLADLESLCSYTRLRELAEADKNGRVVVLPRWKNEEERLERQRLMRIMTDGAIDRLMKNPLKEENGPDIAELRVVNTDRLLELAKADEDGRLFHLPMEPGRSMLCQEYFERPWVMKNVTLCVQYKSSAGIIFYMGYDVFRGLVERGRITPLSQEGEEMLEGKANVWHQRGAVCGMARKVLAGHRAFEAGVPLLRGDHAGRRGLHRILQRGCNGQGCDRAQHPGGHHNGHYPDQCRDHQRHDRALRRG